jgi:hypothetical protein
MGVKWRYMMINDVPIGELKLSPRGGKVFLGTGPKKKSIVSSVGYKQKVIIMDNVNDPLPPEAKKVQSMPNKSEPQQLPNANLNDPIVITKMPYSEKDRP